MKHILLTLSLAFSFSSFATVTSGDMIKAKKFNEVTSHVGEIKQSLLTQEQFQSLQGNCWVKMTGQDVTGSDYASITGKTTLPNTAGRFLRDIGGEAPLLGENQEDELKAHSHNLRSMTYYDNAGVSHSQMNQPGFVSSGSNYSLNRHYVDNSAIFSTGGSETRPKNTGVNYFIKINHECN